MIWLGLQCLLHQLVWLIIEIIACAIKFKALTSIHIPPDYLMHWTPSQPFSILLLNFQSSASLMNKLLSSQRVTQDAYTNYRYGKSKPLTVFEFLIVIQSSQKRLTGFINNLTFRLPFFHLKIISRTYTHQQRTLHRWEWKFNASARRNPLLECRKCILEIATGRLNYDFMHPSRQGEPRCISKVSHINLHQ